MTIKERLSADLKSAMKENDIFRRDTIRLINAGIKQVEVDKRVSLDDEGVMKILLGAKKQRLDSIAAYESAKRDDLVAKEKGELEIILQYLPKQLGDDELRTKIAEIIKNVGANSAKDLGKVMGACKSLQSVADGAKIAKIAKELLG
ncbi:GatB/YqeY domain-containing protein [Helicobacter sp. 23-1045]